MQKLPRQREKRKRNICFQSRKSFPLYFVQPMWTICFIFSNDRQGGRWAKFLTCKKLKSTWWTIEIEILLRYFVLVTTCFIMFYSIDSQTRKRWAEFLILVSISFYYFSIQVLVSIYNRSTVKQGKGGPSASFAYVFKCFFFFYK